MSSGQIVYIHLIPLAAAPAGTDIIKLRVARPQSIKYQSEMKIKQL